MPLPIVILFVIAQRYLIEGITMRGGYHQELRLERETLSSVQPPSEASAIRSAVHRAGERASAAKRRLLR